MKKLIFLLLTVFAVSENAVFAQATGSGTGCVTITCDTAVSCGRNLWDVTLGYDNPSGGTNSIKVSCGTGACGSECKKIHEKSGKVTIRIECESALDIHVKTYLGPNCQGVPCDSLILPVSLVNFNLTTRGNNVVLKWTTMAENDNRGFAIERSVDGTTWNQIVFVNSLAPTGTSEGVLNYSYEDNFAPTAMTLYRLRQVNIDNVSKFSQILALRPKNQFASDKIVIYPNPGRGVINITFDGSPTNTHNVFLTDVMGRKLQSWQNLTNNALQLSNLLPGTYFITVVSTANLTARTEKFSIQ